MNTLDIHKYIFTDYHTSCNSSRLASLNKSPMVHWQNGRPLLGSWLGKADRKNKNKKRGSYYGKYGIMYCPAEYCMFFRSNNAQYFFGKCHFHSIRNDNFAFKDHLWNNFLCPFIWYSKYFFLLKYRSYKFSNYIEKNM